MFVHAFHYPLFLWRQRIQFPEFNLGNPFAPRAVLLREPFLTIYRVLLPDEWKMKSSPLNLFFFAPLKAFYDLNIFLNWGKGRNRTIH